MPSDTEETIAHAKRSKRVLRDAVKEAEQRISQYNDLIARGGGGYDVDSLIASNEHAKEQIQRFEKEMLTAQNLIVEARKQEEAINLSNSLKQGVVLDADTDD
jgi:hypothetical protein